MYTGTGGETVLRTGSEKCSNFLNDLTQISHRKLIELRSALPTGAHVYALYGTFERAESSKMIKQNCTLR